MPILSTRGSERIPPAFSGSPSLDGGTRLPAKPASARPARRRSPLWPGTHPLPASRFVGMLCLLALALLASTASAQTSREYQLKAVFLYNFAQFTEWPSNSLPAPDDPLIIGVLGENPFGLSLNEIVKDESVQGHKLVVRYYHSVAEIKACHILFISQSEARRLESIVNSLKGKPVLTVSDIAGSGFYGVMVELFTENNRIRFRVNLDEVNAAKLSLSSKLLRLAQVIYPARRP